MFERFTDRARRVLVLAQEEARLLNHSFIGTEHILLGLVHEDESVAAQALKATGISLPIVRQRVEETVGMAATGPGGSPPFTPRAKQVMELSLREALQLGHSYIGPEHLLLGLIREGEGVAVHVLVSQGVDLSRLRQQVIQLMAGNAMPVPGTTSAPRTFSRCAFCERDIFEVERFVTNGHLRICDECIRASARVLDQATPERRQLLLPPRVFGSPPRQGTVSAIVEAVQLAFGATTSPEDRAAVVEDFHTLEPIYAHESVRLAPEPEATRVARVRFLSSDLAEISGEITLSEGITATFEGRIRRRDERWRVTADTVTSVLRRM